MKAFSSEVELIQLQTDMNLTLEVQPLDHAKYEMSEDLQRKVVEYCTRKYEYQEKRRAADPDAFENSLRLNLPICKCTEFINDCLIEAKK